MPTMVASGWSPAAQLGADGDLAGLLDAGRLAALRGLGLLDGPPRPELDRLVRLACELLDAPIGLLSLVDADRQFFLAAYGLPESLAIERQSGLDHSLCRYAVAAGRPVIVGDLHQDPVLAAHPAVTGLGIRAYAGIPLTDPNGYAFGTLCVIDRASREWDDHQLATLARLADIATEVCIGSEGPGAMPDACPSAGGPANPWPREGSHRRR